MDTDVFSVNANFCRFCDTFLIGRGENDITAVADTGSLDSIADDLARDEVLRVKVGNNNPSIWPHFHQVWDILARRVAFDVGDASTRSLVTHFARFTRNLVAAVPSNQQNAFASEPFLRRILHVYSSWSATQDPQSYATTCMLIQTLSNIVTSNEGLMNRLWEAYLNLPEEHVIFIRLLDSPDTRTILSLVVLFLNCVHQSNHRQGLLAETRVGARICTVLLDRMVALYDADDPSDGGKTFDYGYHLFAHLFDGGFVPQLYANLKVTGELIAPHQTTLLKLLDSYLRSSHPSMALEGMCPMLIARFFELCTFSTQAVRKSIGTEAIDNVTGLNTDSPCEASFDLLLPRACEALVLVTQCLISVMLEFEENCIKESLQNDLSLPTRRAVSPHGQDLAVCIVELLRLLEVFLPRINFGKPVSSSKSVSSVPRAADPVGFLYVKRDLVRLLGILCHRDRKMQDSVRNCDGITVIMNMCVVDERNPYLREHAIFTLRNLLEGNEESQTVLNSIQPLEKWDQEGMSRR